MCRTTDGYVIADSNAARAVKSVNWYVSCEIEVTRVDQCAYIKTAVLRGRNVMECHSELVEDLLHNALQYRTVERWEPIPGRRFATREDIANAVLQTQVTRFTHSAANAEANGIQHLPHRQQHVVTVAGDYIKGL
ncbi:uncharacterized protein TNCV_968041 [Trichonephila clavipes]|nr:uncharacterized protein TNCV_968041 [Trichonephila clavipes]